MTRFARRVKALAHHAVGFRGMLIALAAASALAALLVPDWRAALVGLSIVLVALILLLSSVRQAELTEALRQLQRHTQPRKVRGPEDTPGVAVALDPYGPSRSDGLRLQASIHQLNIVRQRLALGSLPSGVDEASTLEVADADMVQDSGPLVTVIVPNRNESRFLTDCLESIRRQSFTEWECIVVDDASNDESLKAAIALSDLDRRFRVARHATHSGLPAARNTGLRLARGRYVAFLDADDMLYPESILDRLETLAVNGRDPLVVGSYCGIEVGAVHTTVDDLLSAEEWTSPSAFIDFLNGSDDCPFPVLAPLVRLDALIAVGGFDESVKAGGEDWDLWQRILRAGYVFIPSRLRTGVYRQRPDSMTKRLAAEHVRQSAILIDKPYERLTDGIRAATEGAFPEPIDSYHRRLLLGRRAIRFAAMSLVSGDIGQYEACLAELDPTSWTWLSRHLDIEMVARDGIRRALGLRSDQVDEIVAHTRVFETRIVRDVASRTTAERVVTASPASPFVDFLLAPLNRAQLDAMTAALPTDAGEVGVLLLDRVAGDQGVAAAKGDLASWSLNEWIIERGRSRVLVVGSIRDGAVNGLVEATLNSGGTAIQVDEPGSELMVLPETRGLTLEHRVSASQRLAAATGHDGFAFAADMTAPGSEWDLSVATSPERVAQLEEKGDLPFDAEAIAEFRDRHRGERVVVIGNGPSLNELDLSLLADIPTIAVNAIFLASDRMGFDPTYYVVEDTAVLRDNLDRIREYKAGHRFFPSMYRDQIGATPNTSFFRMNTGFYEGRSPAFCVPRFSTDAAQRLYSGQSVTIINLQLAYYMGFSEVIMIGMDFSYTVPDSAIVEGNRILSQGDDPNHFHPDYFGKGKVWKDPKLDRVLANYQLAKLMFEADGRRIVNATHGGKLELFDRVEYQRAIGRA